MPQQQWFNNLPDEVVNRIRWGIDPSYIRFIREGETKTVKQVAKHLRNSVSHYNFQVFSSQKAEINQIRFEDFDTYKKKAKTFDAVIPVIDLKIFLIRFSSVMAEIMVELS